VLDKCVRDAGAIAEIINREMEIETYSEMFEKPATGHRPPATGHRPPATGEKTEAPREPPMEGFLSEDDFE
jgi:hypothetical protein